jgi:hypothetical protein
LGGGHRSHRVAKGAEARIEGARLMSPNGLGPESEGETVTPTPHGRGNVRGQLARTKATDRSGVGHPGGAATRGLEGEPHWEEAGIESAGDVAARCYLLSVTRKRVFVISGPRITSLCGDTTSGEACEA